MNSYRKDVSVINTSFARFHLIRWKFIALIFALVNQSASADTIVSVGTDDDLFNAINNAAISGDKTQINFTNDITLTHADLSAITSNNLTINGNFHSLNGGGAFRGFFVYQGSSGQAITVNINNISINNTLARGGDGTNGGLGNSIPGTNPPLRQGYSGGGGGAGLGGGLFVYENATVNLTNVSFDTTAAVGGNGGSGGQDTGRTAGNGGASFTLPAFQGGSGGDIVRPLPPATITSLDGQPGGFGGGGGGGGKCRNQGTSGEFCDDIGGNGGDGGFGSGGGGGTLLPATPLSPNGTGGDGGFGGGTGGSAQRGGGGGGGAGMGGAVFVMTNGHLNIIGGGSWTNGTVSPGAGGAPGSPNGSSGANGVALGSGLFIGGSSNQLGGSNTVTFSPGAGDTLTIGNDITDSTAALGGTFGNIEINGPGILVLSGHNTYQGGTDLNDGILSVGSGNNLGSSFSRLNFNGGILQVTGNTFTSTSPLSHPTFWGSKGGGYDIVEGTNAFTVSDSLSGDGGLRKLGAGTLILSGTNSYTGDTTVSGGVLQGNTESLQGNITNNASVVFNQDTLGTYEGDMSGNGILIKQNGGTLILTGNNNYSGGTTVSGGVLQVNTNSLRGDITNNASVVFDQTFAGTYTGAMSGTGSLTKQNGGTLVLSGLNSYTAGTNLNGGTLSVGSDSNLGDPSGALNFNGGILQVTGTSFQSTPRTINWGSAGGGFDIANLDNVFTVDKPFGGLGSLIKQGDGKLILAGNNNYRGGTIVSAGILQGNTNSLKGDITNNASVVFDQATDGTYAGAMSGTGSLTKQNGGTLILSGLNSYSGGTILNGGALSVGSDSNLGDPSGALNFNGGILQVTGTSFQSTPRTINWGAAGGGFDIANLDNVFTLDKPLGGLGSLIKQGDGKLVLTGNNNYGGGTIVSAGVLQGNTNSLKGDITNNASVVFDQATDGTYASAMSGTGSLTKQNGGTLILSGLNSYSGGTILNGGALSVGLDSNLGNPSGALNFNGGILQVTGTSFQSTPRTINWDAAGGGFDIADASNTFTVNQNLGPGGSLTKLGVGNLALTGTNTYTGTNLNAGTLSVGSDSNLGDPSGALNVNGGILQVTGTSFHSTPRTINLGTAGGGFDIANLNNVFTMNKPLSGQGSLNKLGSGTLVLNGNNNYSGNTTVSAGNLQVGDASHPEAGIFGQVMIDPTGILSGHGTINGNVNNAGGISPGGSIGTLIVKGDVNFTPGSTFNVEINPYQSSLLDVSGLASLGNANVSVLADPGYYTPQTYTILNAGSISGQFSNVNITNASTIASLNLLMPSLEYFPNRVLLNLDMATDPVGPLTKVTNNWFKNTLRTVGGRLNAPLGISCPENSFGFWARGVGMLSSADVSGSAPGYDGGTAGAAMGFDRQFGEHLSLGIAGFTAHSDVSTYQRVTNNSNSDSAGISLYGAYTQGAWQFKSVLGYDNDTYHAQRSLGSGVVSRQANSKTYNNHVNNYSEISYSFKSSDLTLQPLAGLQLGWMRQNGFTETGGGLGQNLSVNGRTLYTLDTLAGIRTRKELDLNETFKAQIEVRAIYDHDFGTLQNSVSGQFTNGQRGMLETADRPGQRDSGIVGASFALLTTNSLNFYLDYNGEFWSGQQAHFINAGVRYSW